METIKTQNYQHQQGLDIKNNRKIEKIGLKEIEGNKGVNQ